MMRNVTRREFLNKSILGLSAIGISGLIGSCAPNEVSDNPLPSTDIPTATNQTIATNTPMATLAPSIPLDPNRASIMAHWPVTETSRVVKVHRSGTWAGADTSQEMIFQMLDEGLSTLTGIADKPSAWQALFNPGDRVLLKVNCIDSSIPTPPVLTYAVAQRLIDAGLTPENILIFDRTDRELQASGYTLNESDPGIRCHGSRGDGTEAVLSQATVRFFKEFDECDAVINLPFPRSHPFAGITVALKNHYGSVDQPMRLHGNSCEAVADLNSQPNIRDKTRLIIGSALLVASGNWRNPETEDSLLLSFDPVALDTVSRDILVGYREAQGQAAGSLIDIPQYLQRAQYLNLGANDPTKIELIETTLA